MLRNTKVLVIYLTLVNAIESKSFTKFDFDNPLHLPEKQAPILNRSKRVVGGFPTDINRLPFMVNIRRDGVFECGGSLISSKCVLTAAHCVKTGRTENFTIRGGNTYLDEKSNTRRVKRIFMHKLYDNKTLNYDVAIFELQMPLLQKRNRVDEFNFPAAIKYAKSQMDMPLPGDSVLVSGWGLTSETSTRPSNQLRSVQVNVLPNAACQRLYQNYRNVTSRMFCASVPGRRDACSADSGGPAVFNGKVVGIVSWGKSYECARPSSPGVYVNVAEVSDWIDDVLEHNCA